MASAPVPAPAENEFELITRLLVDEFERAVFGATSQWRRSARLLAIILFGADAAASPVAAAPGSKTADQQILIVVSDERLTERRRYWCGAEERLDRAYTIHGTLAAPVHLLVVSMNHVNRQLERGRPFFTKIFKRGVRLYEAPAVSFSRTRPMHADVALAESRAYFEEWMSAAERRLKTFKLEEAEARWDSTWRRDAAFTLHQAVERLYGCLLLTIERYSPVTHQIGALRSLAEQLQPRLAEAWPRDTKEERRAFELLRQAYIRGRYARDFRITQDELTWLAARVRLLEGLVRSACESFISSPAGAVGKS